MCGIVGFVSRKGECDAGRILYEGLAKLEYRGYDSCGIALVRPGTVEVRKGVGKVAEVAQAEKFGEARGATGMGHCLHPDTLVQLADGEIRPISGISETGVLSLRDDDLKFVGRKTVCGRH